MENANRFDQYNFNQIQIARTIIPAAIALNTAPFLIVLHQVAQQAETTVPTSLTNAMLCWGMGAFFGTFTWMLAYINAVCLTVMVDKGRTRIAWIVAGSTQWFGVFLTLVTIGCFGFGVWQLAASLN